MKRFETYLSVSSFELKQKNPESFKKSFGLLNMDIKFFEVGDLQFL